MGILRTLKEINQSLKGIEQQLRLLNQGRLEIEEAYLKAENESKDEKDWVFQSNYLREVRERELREAGHREAAVEDFLSQEFRE